MISYSGYPGLAGVPQAAPWTVDLGHVPAGLFERLIPLTWASTFYGEICGQRGRGHPGLVGCLGDGAVHFDSGDPQGRAYRRDSARGSPEPAQ